MAAKRKTYAKFQCTECKEINYTVHKARPKVEGGAKLELKKHCKTCRKHTLHKEGKK
ncbi:MAG: 50S ribosomal protein L33 [bacterium]|nr:50S ribosomal protein L33 [bacterium]